MVKTGFSFLDNTLGDINTDDLIVLQGECVQTEQFTISLMQGILKHNDGYIILFNAKDFRELTLTVFDDFPADDDISLVGGKLAKERILKRNLTIFEPKIMKNSLDSWLKNNKYKHLQDKKLLAIFTSLPKHLAEEADIVLKFKELAKTINTPIFYLQEFNFVDYEVADKIIKVSAFNNYQDPIEIMITKPQSAQNIIKANEGSLRYSPKLKDCVSLWFYENNS